MKIEMLTDHYSSVNGFRLIGKGVHEVSPEKGKYLLETFPDLFQPAEAAADKDELQTEVHEGIDEAAEPGTGETGQTAEPEPAAEVADEDASPESEAPEATQEEAEPTTPTKSLSKMNKDELQALAAEIGAEVNPEMTGDQLRAAIKAVQEAA